MPKFAVGSMVRAKRGTKRCRAVVATVDDDGTREAPNAQLLLLLLWEPYYPARISEIFLIAPKSHPQEHDEQTNVAQETTARIAEVEALLPFETEIYAHNSNNHDSNNHWRDRADGSASMESIVLWKDRGDQLLRLGDPSSAVSYYERALSESSKISIGGTVLLSVEGFPRMAEVDCFDEDDGTIDVTLVHNGDETTVAVSSVLLGVLEDDATSLQERILLNLARCMHQLSELDVASMRPRYLKSAVLAATLAETMSSFQGTISSAVCGGKQSLSKHAMSALLLRCKAYTALSQWSRAKADARKLAECDTDGSTSDDDNDRRSYRERGRKLLISIEGKKKLRAKTDKKLAKDICRLVQSATTTTTKAASESSSNSVSRLPPDRDSGNVAIVGQSTNETVRSSTTGYSHVAVSLFGFASVYRLLAALIVVLISVWMALTTDSENSSRTTK